MDSQYSIKKWYKQQIYSRRLSYCLICLIAIQTISSLILCFLINFSIIHPLQSLKDTLSITVSLITFGYNIILALLICSLTLIHSFYYEVIPKVFLTRLQLIWSVLNPSSLMIVCFYSISGSIFVLLYLAIADGPYSTLTTICVEDRLKLCLNEGHLILILHGAFVGILYCMRLFANNYNYVYFPIIQQNKFFQVKIGLSSNLKDAFVFTIMNSKWFILFYAICGPSLQVWITDLLHLRLRSLSTLMHLRNLVNLHLWWMALLTGSTVYFLFCAVAFVFKVFQTERIEFPVDSPFEQEDCRSLKAAIIASDLPILQHLGYLDLSLAAKHSPLRRRDIFAISQPGGHPHHWNSVVNECLGQIKVIIKKLNCVNDPPLPELPFRSDQDRDLRSKLFMSSSYEKWRSEALYSDSLFSPKMLPRDSPGDGANISGVLKPFPSLFTQLKSCFKNKYEMMWNAFLNIRIIAYFAKEMPEACVRRIFAECQLGIWAIEALSFLAATSLFEDKYGVVQRDLGHILSTLLELQQILSKVQKFETATSKRLPTLHCQDPDVSLKMSLKCCVKLALYRITTMFKNHLSSVELSSDHHKLLSRYMECKE